MIEKVARVIALDDDVSTDLDDSDAWDVISQSDARRGKSYSLAVAGG